MLDSFEITSLLEELHLERKKNKRITRFRVNSNQYIHVKTSSGLVSKPVYKAPLVINPLNIKFKGTINSIKGINVDWGNYIHNTNLKGYEFRNNGGENEIQYGFAVDVESKTALKKLLNIIDPLGFKPESNPLEDITAAEPSLPTDETTRKTIVDARIGQGQFRKDLITHWGRCAVSGAGNTLMLKASHIKPWKDSDNKERLDHFNGLLLTANLDAAFDSGLISFNDSGKLLISESFDDTTDYGISTSMCLRDIQDEHKPYLQYHRDNVFKGTP